MTSPHCQNLTADRKLGAYWERQFCKMMADIGKTFSPLQIGRTESASAWSKCNGKWNHLTLPDVTVWTAPGEHHELKHKTTTRFGTFGLEKYRLDALTSFANETEQAVYYTIHDHHGDRDNCDNHPGDWITANVLTLAADTHLERWGNSYVGGERTRVLIWYWARQLFQPLFPND